MIDVSSSFRTSSIRSILQILHHAGRQDVNSRGQGATRAVVNVSWSRQGQDRAFEAASAIMRLVMDAQGNTSMSVFAPNADLSARTGRGNDTIAADVGSVSGVRAGAGDDVIAIQASSTGERAVDLVGGQSGDDSILISAAGGVDRTEGGRGNDTIAILSRADVDRTEGGAGDDSILIAAAGSVDRTEGGNGDDTMAIFSRDDISRTEGGSGDDTMTIKADRVWLVDGDEGDDTMTVTALYADGIDGGDGADTLRVSAAAIGVTGGKGNDLIMLDSSDGLASTVYFAEGDGDDIVETNGPLEIRRYSSDGTKPVDQEPSVTHNDDGTLTIEFGGRDSITVKATGALAGKELVVDLSGANGRLLVRAADGQA